MFGRESGKQKNKQTSEIIKTNKTVSNNGREYRETVTHFSSSIQSEQLTEFTRHYTSTLSQQTLQRDANVFQKPAYQSPTPRRLGPFASYAANHSSNPSTIARRRSNSPTSCNSISKPSLPKTNVPFSTQVPTYEVQGPPRGEVLVINIKKFHRNQERDGSEFDKKALEKLFRKTLKFNVKTYEDLTANAIVSQIEKFRSSLVNVDISIVILMSHGSNIKGHTAIPGGYTNIYGSDDKPVLVDDILELFTTSQCPGMASKPKIFIFQCCRGHNMTELATDGPHQAKNRLNGDMLIAYSTLPGFASMRDPKRGSWFIQGLCDVFSEGYSRLDVESLLKKVQEKHDSEAHRRVEQIMTYENRGFKTCYLCNIRELLGRV